MRFSVWFVIFTLLPLAACDSGENSLEACSFDATASGFADVQLSGNASFGDFGSGYSVIMFDTDEDTLRSISLLRQGISVEEGSFSLDPNSENGWLGLVRNINDGSEPILFRSTGGTIRITSVVIDESPDRLGEGSLEGQFNMDAATEDGDTVTIEGAFNATTECPQQ